MRKNDFVLSVISLLIVIIRSVVVCRMGSPGALFVIIPSGIPHIYRLYCLMQEKREN